MSNIAFKGPLKGYKGSVGFGVLGSGLPSCTFRLKP